MCKMNIINGGKLHYSFKSKRFTSIIIIFILEKFIPKLLSPWIYVSPMCEIHGDGNI
jgi:hypothetical protein